MGLRDTVWQVPLRGVTGAYILDSGLGKRRADPATAEHLHGFAAGAYPPMGKVGAGSFTAALSAGEIVLGSALLVPLVPAEIAGAALLLFGAGLVGLYARTPGMRRPGSLFPSPDGLALAKDTWLMAIGAALLIGDRHRRRTS